MSVNERLRQLEQRVTRLEVRAEVLRPEANRRVLETLGKFARGPLNDGSLAMTADAIRDATGLGDADLVAALNRLIDADFVEPESAAVNTGRWRITVDGLWAIGG